MTEWVPVIYGIGLDAAGRCQHYHLETDIAALWCRRCQHYYACYRCHDTLCQHTFVASAPTDLAVMCGACRYRMTVDRYHERQCPHCHRPFNPRCRLHDKVYFLIDEREVQSKCQ
ncbi:MULTISPECIES: CHY zinc finger protein [Lactiplantibacillus]|uniref:hypothetical protein n=1 Tax=Lactiplantibacillus TaxID=2767842 RepID=UPI000E09634C|nr:hypothetical protein [Lactiplantibacillus plantarum]MPQ39041.1 hypothetical protein [Lactiplantibacillus plantarum]MZU90608.1 hypothetical protein [Lactiplantibacillus plantarum]RDG01823.1 hypothetical protein DQM19_06115 [Lactiplantibacillus plantarum]